MAKSAVAHRRRSDAKPDGRTGPRPKFPCQYCGEMVGKGGQRAHEQFSCEKVPGKHGDFNELPPGSTVGVGVEAKKKPWTWESFQDPRWGYPKSTWIRGVAMTNPPGGISVNGLHVELIPGREGCFLTMGSRPGTGVVYSPTIPPPHWDVYMRSLEEDRMRGFTPGGGIGQSAPPATGPLESQVFVDTETGERIVDPY